MASFLFILYTAILALSKASQPRQPTVHNASSCLTASPCLDRMSISPVVCYQGDFAVFECRVVGVTSLSSVTWYGPHYEDMPLVVGSSVFLDNWESRVSVEVNQEDESDVNSGIISRLVIDFLRLKDAGNYKCTANGILENSIDFKLIVLDSPTNKMIYANHDNDRQVLVDAPSFVQAGGNVTLICKALANHLHTDTFSVDWYRNELPVVSRWPHIIVTKSFEVRSKSEFTKNDYSKSITELAVYVNIHNVDYWFDAGLYTCKTSHMEGYRKVINSEKQYRLKVKLRRRDFHRLTTTLRPTRMGTMKKTRPSFELVQSAPKNDLGSSSFYNGQRQNDDTISDSKKDFVKKKMITNNNLVIENLRNEDDESTKQQLNNNNNNNNNKKHHIIDVITSHLDSDQFIPSNAASQRLFCYTINISIFLFSWILSMVSHRFINR